MGLNDNNTVLQVSQQRQEEIQIHDQEQAQQQDQAAAQQLQEERQEQAEGQIAQPGQVQEEAAPAMEEQARQQGMSRKERRSLRKQEARQQKQVEQARRKEEQEQQKAKQARRKAEQKAQREKEKREKKTEKQWRKEYAKAKVVADNAIADMKEKMQMQLTEAEKLEKKELAEEIERYRIWYESSECTAPLAPEVDALQQMVLAYIQDEAIGMPLFRRLCALSAEAEEADHMRQEAFFRDMFTEDYLAINGKPIPVGLHGHLQLAASEAHEKIEPIRKKVFGMIDEVTRHMTEEEKREAAGEHGMLVGRGRTEYLRLVRFGDGRRFRNINDAKINYARRAYRHGIGR